MESFENPPRDCDFCPRLQQFREKNRAELKGHQAPVPAFGGLDANFLVVGLAPGLHGANTTGRPFTGDFAGDVLYAALLKHGFASGTYQKRADDGLQLVNCRITNAVRCVPPENKPTPAEIKQCGAFLKKEIAAMPNLKVILSLGLVSHNAVLKALGQKAANYKFVHGAAHVIRHPSSVILLNSYHTSRYNINTGRLTMEMFDTVIKTIRKRIH